MITEHGYENINFLLPCRPNSRSLVAFYILISRHIQEAVNLPERGTLKEL